MNACIKDDSTPIHPAFNNRGIKVVKLLITHVADVATQDSNRSTPLCLASDDGIFELVKLLIQYGADMNARVKKNSTLSACSIIASRTVEAVKLLLGSGAENKRTEQ